MLSTFVVFSLELDSLAAFVVFDLELDLELKFELVVLVASILVVVGGVRVCPAHSNFM